MKVLISDKMSPKAQEILKEHNIDFDVKTGLSEDELCDIIGDYAGLAIRSATKVTEKVLNKAKNLKVIGRAGIGVDNVDREAATSKGIIVMNTPFGNSITTAEHSIAMMMSAARQIPQADKSTHEGKWEKSKFMGKELAFKTLGLIGCGNIGAIVADRAQGLKMKVIAFDPYLTKEKAESLNVEKVELNELLEKADFITLHTPLNDSTRGILDAKAFDKVKKDVIIINCARGGLIVEEDLKKAIEDGKVASAALDVFEEEPATDNILFGMEQVICTPHLGASTSEAQENVAIQVAEQIADYLNNGTVTNAINTISLSAEDAVKVKPYIDLAKQLGNFSGQLIESAIKSIKIEYEGAVTAYKVSPISSAIISSVLSSQISNVNLINANIVAKERGIEVSEVKHDRVGDYQTLIGITIKTEDGVQYVAGTLFGSAKPRIVKVGNVILEASIGTSMLYVKNEDKPGLIGNLGNLLGNSDINIANFHLGRGDGTDEAVALVEIDQTIDTKLLQKVNELPSVINAKLLSC